MFGHVGFGTNGLVIVTTRLCEPVISALAILEFRSCPSILVTYSNTAVYTVYR